MPRTIFFAVLCQKNAGDLSAGTAGAVSPDVFPERKKSPCFCQKEDRDRGSLFGRGRKYVPLC